MALTTGSSLAASEVGDTGELPATAQEVGPAGPLHAIDGNISGLTDRDVYKICLTSGPDFSASTIGNAGFDTQLFLLNSEGKAVYANDDIGDPSLPPRVSRLPAGSLLGPQTPGVYYLAISAFNVDPNGDAGALFMTASTGVVGPARVGGNRPMTGWFGTASTPGGAYKIDLTGAESCIPPDLTAPTIDLRTPQDGDSFQRGQTVLADYSCTDEPGGSGLASCVGSAPSGLPIDTSELGDHTFTVTATDNKGNTRTSSVTYHVVDETDPTVELSTPPEGAVYDRGDEVLADYSCADEGGSGLASCDGDVADGEAIDTSSLGDKAFTVTATDGAGNETAVTHHYTVVDGTDPSVDLNTPAEGASYERGASVAAAYTCSDDAGGSGIASCVGDVPSGSAIDTTTLGDKSFTVTATDAAGNTKAVTHHYSVVDGRGPAITIRTPADGAVYEAGQTVVADYECADEAAGSGLASCVGDVPDGSRVDTSAFGPHSFTVRATDKAGNRSTKTVTYVVGFDFGGFYLPLVNRPRVNVMPAGAMALVEFTLEGHQHIGIRAKGYPRVVPMACGSHADLDGGDSALLVHRKHIRGLVRDLYVYYWKTDSRWEGSCRQFVLKLVDGSYHRLDFRFPEKPHGKH
jgi:hypothetical protein